MSPAEKALAARIKAQAAKLQPKAAERLLAAYDLIRAQMTDAQIMSALRTGSIDRFLAEVLSDRSLDGAFSALRLEIDKATLNASADWYRAIPSRIRVGVEFDVLNPRVLEAVRDLDTRAISTLKDEVRESVRQAVRDGLEAGKGPRVIATRVREAVGLPPNLERAVANGRAELEAGDRAFLRRVLGKGVIRTEDGTEIVRSGHAGGKGVGSRDMAMLERKLGKEPLAPAEIDRVMKQYHGRLQAVNTEAVTRSVALDSQRLAQRNSWTSAIDRGLVEAARLQRTRIEVMDERTRVSHRPLHGETAGYDQPYSNGEMVAGESDYGCRAIERWTLKATPRAHAA